MADSYGGLADIGSLSPNDAFPKAKSLVQKALDLDDTLAVAHLSLAAIRAIYDWDWVGAEREFQRALQLQPGNATAHHWYVALLLTPLGRFDEALAEIKRAQELDPLSLLIINTAGFVYLHDRQYDQAIRKAQEALEMQSAFSEGYSLLGSAYRQKGMYDKAIAAYQEAIALSGRHAGHLASLGHAYAMAGRTNEVLEILDELTDRAKETYVSPFDMAVICVGLGEKNRVFGWLERAYDERSTGLTHLGTSPTFDSLRDDPRFDDLLRRIGLDPESKSQSIEPLGAKPPDDPTDSSG